MSVQNPPPDSDPEQGQLGDSVSQQYVARLQRAVGYYNNARQSDSNLTVPKPIFNPKTRQRYFEDSPTQLARLFGSPLAEKGVNAQGPKGERLVTSGWGDARSIQYDANVDSDRRHAGLDFRAPVGETVYASADGVVTFVGAQLRPSSSGRAVNIAGAQSDANGNVLDGSGNQVLTPGQLGHGGIFIQIRHNGDFQNYWTEYMHLSAVSVKEGDHVLAGAVVGKVGRTGGNRGITTGPHLHWQVRFLGTIVRPDPLVPHYWPGHDNDAYGSPVGVAVASLNQQGLTVAESIVTNQVANQLQSLERATNCENFTGPQLKAQQATHSALLAQNLAVHAGAMYDAIAKFQAELPVVSTPMTFDFDAGVWTDGKAV
jgi:murein DD-endopeptidase MepM/ murein hydrolase activator NlpD